jgi:hypothetical protein
MFLLILTIIYIFLIFVNTSLKELQKNKNFSESIAPNVPAVYDVFAVAIKETEGFQQPQKCGGEKPHKGRKPDCGFS